MTDHRRRPFDNCKIILDVDNITVELTRDPVGHHGTIEYDGDRYLLHCTITRTGPPARTPAKARMRRDDDGQAQFDDHTCCRAVI